jgi:pimeloyl-ACP methyl ester carboxylesterase
VAGLSVPFVPASPASLVDALRVMYAGRFFYQLYFQAEGVVEAEVEADMRGALRRIYYTISGNAPLNAWLAPKPADARLLDGMVDPDPFPAWMSDADLQVYVDAFEAGGFRGPINRYRAQVLDPAELADIHGKPVTQPACFIGGGNDAVRAFVPGMDLYADPGANCLDYRGTTIIPGIGHWVQQEAPDAVNAALEAFLTGL